MLRSSWNATAQQMEQGLQISSHGTGSVLQIWLDCPIAEDKKGETVTEAFKTIFKEGRKPQYLWTDKGKEYYNKNMKELLEKNNITLYSTENDVKSSVRELYN